MKVFFVIILCLLVQIGISGDGGGGATKIETSKKPGVVWAQKGIYGEHRREKGIFDIIALGTEGGPFWSSATSFLLQCPYAQDASEHNFIALDGGYLLDGIKEMGERGYLEERYANFKWTDGKKKEVYWNYFWKKQIQGGLLTHSHLDHTGGMIIANQLNIVFANWDKSWFMNIVTMQNLIDHVFNEAIWPILAGPGPKKIKGKTMNKEVQDAVNVTDIPIFPNKFDVELPYNDVLFDYLNLLDHDKIDEVDLNGKKIKMVNYHGKTILEESCPYVVSEFPVNHGAVAKSSAFLIEYQNNGQAIMFFGDTGPDKLNPGPGGHGFDETKNLENIWKQIATYRKDKRLSTIFIEVAQADPKPNAYLYGHFKPTLFIQELEIMHFIFQAQGVEAGIEDMNFVIIHIKGSSKALAGTESRSLIQSQLKELHAESKLPSKITFHFPMKFEHIRIDAGGKLTTLAPGETNDRIEYPETKLKKKVASSLMGNMDWNFYYGFVLGAFFIVVMLFIHHTCFRFPTRKDWLEPFGPEFEL